MACSMDTFREMYSLLYLKPKARKSWDTSYAAGYWNGIGLYAQKKKLSDGGHHNNKYHVWAWARYRFVEKSDASTKPNFCLQQFKQEVIDCLADEDISESFTHRLQSLKATREEALKVLPAHRDLQPASSIVKPQKGKKAAKPSSAREKDEEEPEEKINDKLLQKILKTAYRNAQRLNAAGEYTASVQGFLEDWAEDLPEAAVPVSHITDYGYRAFLRTISFVLHEKLVHALKVPSVEVRFGENVISLPTPSSWKMDCTSKGNKSFLAILVRHFEPGSFQIRTKPFRCFQSMTIFLTRISLTRMLEMVVARVYLPLLSMPSQYEYSQKLRVLRLS